MSFTNKVTSSRASASPKAGGLTRRQLLAAASLGAFAMAVAGRNLALATEDGVSAETAAALASAQASYQQAMSDLGTLNQQAEEAQYNLSQTQAQLDDTNAQIDTLEASIIQKQAELSDAQDVLAQRLDASYRAGKSNLLEVLLNAADFEDFVNRVAYSNSVSDSDAEAIQVVKDIKAELQSQEDELQTQKTQQEELVAQQQADADELSSRVSAMESYVGSLSSEVVALMNQAQQEQLAAREAAYNQWLAEQAAAEAQQASVTANAGAEATGATVVVQQTVTDDYGNEQVVEVEVPVVNEGDTDVWVEEPVYTEPEYTEPTYTEPVYTEPVYTGGNHVGAVASIAWNYIGVPYVYGGTDPSGFDCSGLTQYCYAQAGYSIGRTTYDQIAQIQAAGQWVSSMDQLQPGDLVFPHTGHVGIYEGGGMMIHAPQPGESVSYISVYAFYGGGCPV